MTHILYLNGLSVTNNVLSGLAAPLASGDATNKLYVDAAVSGTATAAALAVTNLIDNAPAAMNTLKELADALGDDAAFSVTVTNALTANATSITTEATTARAAELVLRNDLATLDGQHDALQVLHTGLRTDYNALASSTPSTTSFGKVTAYIEALHNYFFENNDPQNPKPKPTLPQY